MDRENLEDASDSNRTETENDGSIVSIPSIQITTNPSTLPSTSNANQNSDNDLNQKSKKKNVIDERMTDFRMIMKSFENKNIMRMTPNSASSPQPPKVHWHERPRSSKPKLPTKSEKSIWLNEMKRRGITYTSNLQAETLFPHVKSYALFFNDQSRLTNSESWLLNLQFFLKLVSEKSKDDGDNNQLTNLFYLVENIDIDEDVTIKTFVRGKLDCENVVKETKANDAAHNASREASIREKPVDYALSGLANMGAEFKKIEVGIGLPNSVLENKKCLVLEAELPPRMTSDESTNLNNRIAFFTNLMESTIEPTDTPYKFYVIQRYDISNTSNYNVTIRQYQNGCLINEDFYLEYEKYQSLCLVRMERDANDGKVPRLPRRKAFLEISCPCSIRTIKRWSCADCLEDVIYGYDGYLYCLCGKSNVDLKLTFRCNEKSHGSSFKVILGKIMTAYLSQLKPIEEINILFLGETGVGKSTFINSFANYFSFSSLEEASNSDLLALIPTYFTMFDDDMKERVISFGCDQNEKFKTGQSATQSCKSYVVRHGDRMLQLIDTAGIGDTRGIEYDRKNFENIISFISHIDSIHAVCILLKPNLSRLTTVFQFCVKGLLCQLHKSASENILFLFTNTRSTFYKPGETLPNLRTLLNDISESEPYVTIPLEPYNTFCFDSEAFRFLVAIRNGIQFSEQHRKAFQQSWEKSATESNRLLDHVFKLKPHSASDTVSLSQCRKMINGLSKPLADISRSIVDNIILLEDQEKKYKKATEDISILNQKLYIPVLHFETNTLEMPKTVCTSENCVEVFTVDGITNIDYVTVCHNPCYLNATAEVVNCSELLECWAMDGTETCRNCKCSWRVHMHIYYELVHKTLKKKDVDVEYDMNSKESSIKAIQKVIYKCEKRRDELMAEKDAITKACAKFSQFLKKNAITPYNDTILEYINYLIKIGKENSSAHGDNMEKFKLEYLAEIEIVKESINEHSSISTLEPSDITAIINSLYRLRIYGPIIKNMGKMMRNVGKNEHDALAFDNLASVTMLKQRNNLKKLRDSWTSRSFSVDGTDFVF